MHSAQVISVENIPQQRQLAGICKIERQHRTTSAARDSRGDSRARPEPSLLDSGREASSAAENL